MVHIQNEDGSTAHCYLNGSHSAPEGSRGNNVKRSCVGSLLAVAVNNVLDLVNLIILNTYDKGGVSFFKKASCGCKLCNLEACLYKLSVPSFPTWKCKTKWHKPKPRNAPRPIIPC